jgi:hypothetical protein
LIEIADQEDAFGVHNLNPVTVVGTEKRAFISPALGNMFYRLHS